MCRYQRLVLCYILVPVATRSRKKLLQVVFITRIRRRVDQGNNYECCTDIILHAVII